MQFNSKRTPYYCIDLEKLKANYESFRKAIELNGRNDIIAYSVKANYHPAVIQQFNLLGAHFEVCSEYEYKLVLKHGVDSSRIIVNGCFFDDFSLYNESILILDTFTQLSEWIKSGCENKIGIRINLDYLTVDDRFKNKRSRFGIQLHFTRLNDFLKKANLNKIICLHCHLSGNNREPSIYRDVINEFKEICGRYKLNKVKFFDIGGGYKIDKNKNFWSFSDYMNVIEEVCEKNIQIIFEPGNSLVRNCAEYHTKIIAVKTLENENIFIVDGSSLHLPKVDFNKIGYRFVTLNSNEKHCGTKIFGNTCKESDILLKLDESQSLGIGDTLIIENIGAYSINEVNPLILGFPNININNSEKIILGNHLFTFLCKYNDCYNKNCRNNYSIIKDNANEKGLYAFINENNTIIYIGAAYDRELYKRITQHFRAKDTGGLRMKLSDIYIRELENSSLYICKINESKRDILFKESFLIGLYRPKFNFI